MFTGENRDLGCRRYMYRPDHVIRRIDDSVCDKSATIA